MRYCQRSKLIFSLDQFLKHVYTRYYSFSETFNTPISKLKSNSSLQSTIRAKSFPKFDVPQNYFHKISTIKKYIVPK